MSSKRAWVWTGRLAALVAAVVIPACGSTGSPGGSNPNGILWNSIAGSGASSTGPNPGASLYIPASWNTGLGASPIGITNIVHSVDDATYDTFNPSGSTSLSVSTTTIHYIRNNFHPLSTDTGSTSITSRESQLQGLINGYRQQQLGNVGAGGGNVGGGVAVGNVQGIILAGHFTGTKSARAHCKHYALNYNVPLPGGTNPEGDALQTTTANTPGNPIFLINGIQVGLKGRLGKIGVQAFDPATLFGGGFYRTEIPMSGPGLGEADVVYAQLLQTVPADLTVKGWTHFCIGHWRGGFQGFYWYIFFMANPTPTN